MFAVVDEQLSSSFELREVLYGVILIVIFLAFRRGVVQTFVDLFSRLFVRRRAQPALEPTRE